MNALVPVLVAVNVHLPRDGISKENSPVLPASVLFSALVPFVAVTVLPDSVVMVTFGRSFFARMPFTKSAGSSTLPVTCRFFV